MGFDVLNHGLLHSTFLSRKTCILVGPVVCEIIVSHLYFLDFQGLESPATPPKAGDELCGDTPRRILLGLFEEDWR